MINYHKLLVGGLLAFVWWLAFVQFVLEAETFKYGAGFMDWGASLFFFLASLVYLVWTGLVVFSRKDPYALWLRIMYLPGTIIFSATILYMAGFFKHF